MHNRKHTKTSNINKHILHHLVWAMHSSHIHRITWKITHARAHDNIQNCNSACTTAYKNSIQPKSEKKNRIAPHHLVQGIHCLSIHPSIHPSINIAFKIRQTTCNLKKTAYHTQLVEGAHGPRIQSHNLAKQDHGRQTHKPSSSLKRPYCRALFWTRARTGTRPPHSIIFMAIKSTSEHPKQGET
jgi:hypothetical protein